MSKTTRKRISVALAVVCCLSLIVGSFAFFTDKETQSASAQAGNINLTWQNHAENLTDAAEDTTWKTGFDADGVMNPGDTYDFSYVVANAGSKSIDVKQTITLTSVEPITNLNEYVLTITGGEDSVAVVPTPNADNTVLTYELKDIVLSGSVETETDAAVSEDYEVELEFSLGAKNAFMDNQVSLGYQAYAKQHRNAPDAEWALIAEYEAVA